MSSEARAGAEAPAFAGGSPGPEVDLPPESRLIADLHLHPDVPGPWERLERFLDACAGAPALAILGDLFEYWVGPGQLKEPGGARAVALLRRTAARGTIVHVLRGNRDFLLDAAFERASGALLHPEGFVARLPDGTRLLCLHGDELATEDRGYQRLRRVLRSAPVRALARVLPASAGERLARRLRRRSREAVAGKEQSVVALQRTAALERLERQASRHLVCGHAHRFRQEALPEGGQWTVLDAFGSGRDVARVTAAGLVFEASGP